MARTPKAPTPDDPGEVMWRRVKASVRPIKARVVVKVTPADSGEAPFLSPSPSGEGLGVGPVKKTPRQPTAPTPTRAGVKLPPAVSGDAGGITDLDTLKGRGFTLPPPTKPPATIGSAPIDKGWERDLKSGRLSPDLTVDLHGHYLAGAHVALSRALDRAAAMGARVILVIAGKQRGPDEAPRGAIRRELTTWLAHSHHSSRILAVRNAHPRHGGAGAVYVVLRKG